MAPLQKFLHSPSLSTGMVLGQSPSTTLLHHHLISIVDVGQHSMPPLTINHSFHLNGEHHQHHHYHTVMTPTPCLPQHMLRRSECKDSAGTCDGHPTLGATCTEQALGITCLTTINFTLGNMVIINLCSSFNHSTLFPHHSITSPSPPCHHAITNIILQYHTRDPITLSYFC